MVSRKNPAVSIVVLASMAVQQRVPMRNRHVPSAPLVNFWERWARTAKRVVRPAHRVTIKISPGRRFVFRAHPVGTTANWARNSVWSVLLVQLRLLWVDRKNVFLVYQANVNQRRVRRLV